MVHGRDMEKRKFEWKPQMGSHSISETLFVDGERFGFVINRYTKVSRRKVFMGWEATTTEKAEGEPGGYAVDHDSGRIFKTVEEAKQWLLDEYKYENVYLSDGILE